SRRHGVAELADATTSTPRTSLPIREVAISGRVALLSRLVADASVRHDIFFGNRPPIRKVIPLRSVPPASQPAERDAAPGPSGFGHGILQRCFDFGAGKLVIVNLAKLALLGESESGSERDFVRLSA